MEFFIKMNPPTITAQEKKVAIVKGKPVFYEPTKLKQARVELTERLYQFKPDTPYDHGVRLIVKWIFPIVKGRHDGQYKTTKPDTDNLQKMLKDCMTTCGFWRDDALVASEIVEKFWGNITGIYIRIDDLEGE